MDPENNQQTDTENPQTQDERHAAFAAGFDDDDSPTETPPGDSDDEAGAGEQAKGADEQQSQAAPEYVKLTRQELEELKTRAALIEQIKATQDKSFGTMGGRIREIRQRIDSLTNGKRIQIEQHEIDELRKDGFEAHAKALEKLRDLQVVNAGVDPASVEKMVDERAGAKLAEYRQQMESRLLRKVHPDWETYQASEDFAAWVQAQPAEYRAQLAKASDNWDSDFIAEAMTKAKDAAKKKAAPSATTRRPPPSRETVLEAAIQPRGTGAASRPADRSNAFLAGFDEEG